LDAFKDAFVILTDCDMVSSLVYCHQKQWQVCRDDTR